MTKTDIEEMLKEAIGWMEDAMQRADNHDIWYQMGKKDAFKEILMIMEDTKNEVYALTKILDQIELLLSNEPITEKHIVLARHLSKTKQI